MPFWAFKLCQDQRESINLTFHKNLSPFCKISICLTGGRRDNVLAHIVEFRRKIFRRKSNENRALGMLLYRVKAEEIVGSSHEAIRE